MWLFFEMLRQIFETQPGTGTRSVGAARSDGCGPQGLWIGASILASLGVAASTA
jgi:hypothetical protein